jgi:hypothetical protein
MADGPYGGLIDPGAANAAYADQILAMQQAMQGGGGGGGGGQYVSGGDSGVDINMMRAVNNENFRASREQANYMAGLQTEREDRQQAREMQMLQTRDQMEMARMDKQQQLGQDMLRYQLESMTQLELKKKQLEFKAAQVSEEARGPILEELDAVDQELTDSQVKMLQVKARTEGMSKDTQSSIAKQASEMQQRLKSQQQVIDVYKSAAQSTLPNYFDSLLASPTSGLGRGGSLLTGLYGALGAGAESLGEVVSGDNDAYTRTRLGIERGMLSEEVIAAAGAANKDIADYFAKGGAFASTFKGGAVGEVIDPSTLTSSRAHGFTNKTISNALIQTLANGNLAFDQTAATPAINELMSNLQMIKNLPDNTDPAKYGNMVRNSLKEASMAIYGKPGYEGQLADVLDVTLGEMQGMREKYATSLGKLGPGVSPESIANSALLGVANDASNLRFALGSVTEGQVHTAKSLDKALGILTGAKVGTTYELTALDPIKQMLGAQTAGQIGQTRSAMEELVSLQQKQAERELALGRKSKRLDRLGTAGAKKAENRAMAELLANELGALRKGR